MNRRVEMAASEQSRFKAINGAAHVLGLVSVTLIAIWMGAYGSGFSWSEAPDGVFRFHPLFMAIALQLLLGEALLVYRTFRTKEKATTKRAHIVLHSIALLFFIVGLRAVFNSHNYSSPPTANLYSLHSWFGIAVVVLFCLQYLFGFAAFYYPLVAEPLRKSYLPVHRWFGIGLFIMSTAVTFMGITERAAWRVKCWSELCAEGLLANFVGVLLLAYSMTVVYLVSNDTFKRQPLVTEMAYENVPDENG